MAPDGAVLAESSRMNRRFSLPVLVRVLVVMLFAFVAFLPSGCCCDGSYDPCCGPTYHHGCRRAVVVPCPPPPPPCGVVAYPGW